MPVLVGAHEEPGLLHHLGAWPKGQKQLLHQRLDAQSLQQVLPPLVVHLPR